MALTLPQDRMAGFQGAVYFGSAKILDIFDWTLEATQEVAPCGIKGEIHEQYAMGMVTTRVTAQRFVTDVATSLAATGPPTNEQGGSVFGQNLLAKIPSSGQSWKGLSVSYTLYTLDAVNNKGFSITGEGFITRATANNPRGSATEALEIQGTLMPTWTN